MDPQLAASFSVDRDDDLPLATQLAWKLKALIAAGHLRPGARLPGVRDLAEMAGVNANTVRAVYARLDQQPLTGEVEPPRRRTAGRLLSATELESIRDDLQHRVDELRHEDDSARRAYREAQAEEERLRHEEALREAERARPNRVWPHAGAS